MNEILSNLKNKSKPKKNAKKCAIYDFFQLANEIDAKYTPLLIFPMSVKDDTKRSQSSSSSHGLSLSNAPAIFKKSISELFGSNSSNDDEKFNKSNKIQYQRPSYLDYRYPIYKLPQKFKFEAGNPRIELFGKDIVPKNTINLFESCIQSLPNRLIQKYNIYACDIYKYIAVKSKIPDWILMQQNGNKPLNDNNKSSPKWLQNIRMGMGMKMLIKLLCSCMPSSYKNINTKTKMKITNVPDIRYEIVANSFCQNTENDYNYYNELRRNQDILSFNTLQILLGLLKLFKTHEILQFEYLRYLIQKNNGHIVLCKLFNHPFSISTNDNLFITKPKTFIDYNLSQLINRIYGDNNYDDDYKDHDNDNKINNSSPRIITIKINCLRIIQKCVKYSYGHCRVLCDVLKCHEWLAKYTKSNDEVLRYYVLKLYKSMMPFLNKEWRNKQSSINIIELIKNHIRIGINDQWLSFEIINKMNEAINGYKEKEEEPQNLKLDKYYQWLGLKEPTEKDYAETCFNPFYVTNNYGQPKLEIFAPKKWNELIDDSCTEYHEWLFVQIKQDIKQFEKQKKYIGMTKKEMQRQQVIERSDKVDKGLAKIVIPQDFDFSKYLIAYFNGNEDELLNKI